MIFYEMDQTLVEEVVIPGIEVSDQIHAVSLPGNAWVHPGGGNKHFGRGDSGVSVSALA